MDSTPTWRRSYFKAALSDQHNLVLLFGAACLSLAYASLLPLWIGAGAEILWLMLGPQLSAFRLWVDQRSSAMELARVEAAISGALGKLAEPELGRFSSLTLNATGLAAESRRTLAGSEVLQLDHALLELRRTFLDYSFLRQRLLTLADSTPVSQLEQHAAELQQAYSTERELMVRMTIRSTLSSLQKRITERAALAAIEQSILQRLEMLERIVPALGAQFWDAKGPGLARELERSMKEIGPAEPLELALDQVLSQSRGPEGS